MTSPRTTFWTTTDTQTPLRNARLTKWGRNMRFKDIDRNTEILKYSTYRIYAAKTHSAISSPTSAPSVTCLLSAAPQNSKRELCPKVDALLGHFDFMLNFETYFSCGGCVSGPTSPPFGSCPWPPSEYWSDVNSWVFDELIKLKWSYFTPTCIVLVQESALILDISTST